MHDHMKPTIRDVNPDHIILHCRTNDLNSELTASQIARSIRELALLLKSKDNKVLVSLIVPRNDNLSNKASEVNFHLCALNKTFSILIILIRFSQKITLMKASDIILTGIGP